MKNVKKTAVLILAAALLCCSLAGCGGKAAVEVDISAVSKEVLDSAVFSDILSAVPTDTAVMLYELSADDVAECQVYCSTGATAEEVALFKAADEAAAARIKTAVDGRIQHQIQAYESYVPAEVPKLEKAVVMTNGLYVAYVTSEDEAAVEAILKKYM